jgi:RNA polymerase sigma-70 factor (ECF subfamily)
MDAVYRLTSAILGNEADARDAAQETFVAAWRQLPRLREADKLDAWLQRVAVNAARMTLRARGRRRIREIPSSTVAAMAERGGPGRPERDDAAILDAALAILPVEQRSILVLHHLEGQSVNQLAKTLAIPIGTAKSRLFAARRALAAAIASREGGS